MCCWSRAASGSGDCCCPIATTAVSSNVRKRIVVRLVFIGSLIRDNDTSDKLKHIGHYSTQSAMKTFVSPCFAECLFDAKTSFLPSGENIGKPSKVSLKV